MRFILVILLALLFVAHHDAWLWNDERLVFGFLPAGLAYHVVFSFVAALLWWGATRWLWPTNWESWADEPKDDTAP